MGARTGSQTAAKRAPATRKSVFGLSYASALKNGFRKCPINEDMIVGDTGTPLLPSLPVVIERANKG
jgi:hypothetical protein